MRSPSDMVRVGDYFVPPTLRWARSGVGAEPDCVITVKIEDGAPYLAEVSLRAASAESQITDADLQGLVRQSVGDWLSWIVANGPANSVASDGSVGDPVGLRPTEYTDLRFAVGRARKRVELQKVADVYRAGGRRGTQAVKAYLEQVRGKPVNERTAQLWVQRARAANLLGDALKGKAGEA